MTEGGAKGDPASSPDQARLPDSDGTPATRLAGIGAALLLFAAFLWTIHPILNPFLLWFGLLAVLLPFRRSPAFAPVMLVTGVLTAFWVLSELGSILVPFVVAVVFAYILNPLVDRVAALRPLRGLGDGDRLPRTIAVVLLALPVVGGLVAGAIWGVPWLASELADLARRVPDIIARLGEVVQGLEARLARLRIPGANGVVGMLERLGELSADDAVAFLDARTDQMTEWLMTGALGVGRGIWVFLTAIAYLVLTPVIAFYLMRDWDQVVVRAASLVPRSHAYIVEFGRDYDRALASYLRGQVTVSILIGALTALGLLLVGFPYAFLLGLIVAIFNVVPYLGVVLSLLPAIGIALASGDVMTSLVKVAVVYTIAQSTESAVLSPRIVGDSTGLHPVWILFAISVGGFFFGFVGLLVAVPTAVGIKLLVFRGLDRYRRVHLAHPGGHPEEAGE